MFALLQGSAMPKKSHHDDGLMLEVYEAAFKRGDRLSLFRAIDHCARHGLALPGWAAKAFRDGYRKIRDFKAASLDDAFGKPFRKGLHVDRAALRKKHQLDVYLRIQYLHKQGRPIDDALFEEVGKGFGIGRTVCKELYANVKRRPAGKTARAPRKR
ncbi:hypothetical protein ACVWXL_004089 [Bradyrhizobium sp. GM22.5]